MSKKQSTSVRLNETDVKRIRLIAERLGVKESEMVRFIIKEALSKLLPFQDQEMKGVDLMPALIACGPHLAQYFDLDPDAMEEIVNSGVTEETNKVELADLAMLVLSAESQEYVCTKLSSMVSANVDSENLNKLLKNYLREKYIKRPVNGMNSAELLTKMNSTVNQKPITQSFKEKMYV
jgi:hypothetical protein